MKQKNDLDFFGCDNKKIVEKKKKKKKKNEKQHTQMVMNVPVWAGGEREEDKLIGKKKKKRQEGSKERRKRKLSEDVELEEKLIKEEREAISSLLAPPPYQTKQKARTKKTSSKKHRSVSIESANSTNELSENENDDEDSLSLFNQAKHVGKIDEPSSQVNKTIWRMEEMKAFRKKMNIKVTGDNPPNLITQFDEMKLGDSAKEVKSVILKNIENSRYKEPTLIQMQAIPVMLEGRDILATAPTGSGKTAAFAIPILARLADQKCKLEGIRAIVLAPTRELAVQIHSEFVRLSVGYKIRISLLSKATAVTISSLNKNCTVNQDILIATPLRLVNLIKNDGVDLSKVQIVCLDEADRLFDLGFLDQIDEIFAACSNKNVQRAMFSATLLQGVEETAESVLRDPTRVSIGIKNAGASTVDQKLVFVGKEKGKILAMKQLVGDGLKVPVLLFVQNKERAKELHSELIYIGANVDAIHADRTKEQRDQVIRNFRVGKVWILICTDLMSRGMDFKGINMVINYDFPQSAVSYIHRIGRTGRAGRSGVAVTFFTEDDMQYLRSIANVMKISGCDVPDWLLSLKKASGRMRKGMLKKPPLRQRISTTSGYDLQRAHKRKLMKADTKNKPSTAAE